AAHMTARIDWGDGTPTSSGLISGEHGVFFILGSHTYGLTGLFTATVFIEQNGLRTFPVSVPIDVTGVPPDSPLSILPQSITAKAGEALAGVLVATFSDSSSSAPYSATITWGDGTSSAGAIASGLAGFEVRGDHVYARPGSFLVAVTVESAS